MGGWMDGWMEVKAGLRIAYSNQKLMQFKKHYYNREFLYFILNIDKVSLRFVVQAE